MQYGYPQGFQGYSHFYPPPPPPTYYPHAYPVGHYPSGSQNHYPGNSYNSGGNRYDGHGIQRNGDVIVGSGSGVKHSNQSAKQKRRKATIIGGCHGNQGGYQVSGDVILGNI
ncbi:hypothetical protein SOVF_047520 [Spinacia oleracea]|nr:hypothetical protein SOVF_047520 [Spinacia oleracea]